MYLLRHGPFYRGFDPDATVFVSHPNCFAPNKAGTATSPKDNTAIANKNDSKAVYRTIDSHADESDDQFILTMDLPGIKSDQLNVQLTDGGGVLSISADRPTAGGTVVAYRQRFAVDEDAIDGDKIKATLTDGVLTLTLPKKEEAKPIIVPVLEEEAAAITDEDLRITFDVPGIKAADLKVVLQNGTLSITGERKKGNTYAQVQRTMMLDRHRTDLTQPKAYLVHGVLTFTAPHKEQATAKKIQLGAEPLQPQPHNVLVESVPEEEATAKW